MNNMTIKLALKCCGEAWVFKEKDTERLGSNTNEVSVAFTGYYKIRSVTKYRHQNKLNVSNIISGTEDYSTYTE
jgi:uncharacterized lipoprotein YehR (DUF1307 family)